MLGRTGPIALAAALSAVALQAATAADSPMLGFDAAGAASERALEQKFDAALDPADQSAWLKRFSSAANHVGTAHDEANAREYARLLSSWGWDARIETFYVLYPTPREQLLELVAPVSFKAALHEPPIAGDASSAESGTLPPYNVYGADGDVTAELVYVNYGIEEDYRELARRGIDVHGRIVIARYGGGWRGIKVKLAHEHGAVGCIIYSDPHDDGYAMGATYPDGGWRPSASVQRGSVEDITLYPGDPLTPGTPALRDAKRLAIADAATIMKIPSIPISYADAQPLLAQLRGPVAPEGWRGALPITYRMGPGPARVHLLVHSDWGTKPIYDVIARIAGSETADQWVIRGNHHDGWAMGAWDPLSGAVAELDEAKAIGALVKSGWKPRRTLIYASWDGEEPGTLGSTEWAEAHAQELQRKAVAYINSDTNARGFLQAGGSHSLQRLMNEIVETVPDPETGVSVLARQRARLRALGYGRDARSEDGRQATLAASGADLPLSGLGSGSDYSVFLQHLGLAAINLGFSGEGDQNGVYHSLYDTYEHFVRYGDPDFAYGVTLARTAGHFMLRLADAPVLPLQFGGLADTYDGYRRELHELADARRHSSEELSQLIDANVFALASDPQRPVSAPAREAAVPFLDFAPLDNAMERLRAAARRYDDSYAHTIGAGNLPDAATRAALNQLLLGMEQALTDSRGLPRRDWYKHIVYAPGVMTGYGVKTFPAIREAIEAGRWDEANASIAVAAQVLARYCERLDQASARLSRTASG